jgi:TPP-dependent pyruvate/acetoin dehydrogenase alpha subunit
MSFWKENCPIKLLEEKLRESSQLTDASKDRMEAEIRAEIAANFRFAQESPFPENVNWEHANWTSASPLADALLSEAEGEVFDHTQAEAKLGPY